MRPVCYEIEQNADFSRTMNVIRRNKKVVYHKHGLFMLLRYF